MLADAYRALAAEMTAAGEVAAAGGADPWERMCATFDAYRRFAVDKPRRYRLMFSLEYEPEDRTGTDHPLGTVDQAWARAVETYLTAVAPERRAEAQVLGLHLWTAVHGQLVLWRSLPHPQAGIEARLVELERSLLSRLLPGPVDGD
ncbi:TetR-like C-terminal domain-containing protein [Streptomyces canus]|uniref:TetR-like C-terminal domain-containing protein n=1 Tax=Streptomyces canus TaxID=58343 RepID=UPI003717867E